MGLNSRGRSVNMSIQAAKHTDILLLYRVEFIGKVLMVDGLFMMCSVGWLEGVGRSPSSHPLTPTDRVSGRFAPPGGMIILSGVSSQQLNRIISDPWVVFTAFMGMVIPNGQRGMKQCYMGKCIWITTGLWTLTFRFYSGSSMTSVWVKLNQQDL